MSSRSSLSPSTSAWPAWPARSSLLRTLSQWHWISAALALAGLLLFSVTGITLNHANLIPATPVIDTRTATVPSSVLKPLAVTAETAEARTTLPVSTQDWIASALDVQVDQRPVEWSADEVYVALPEPGGDAWLSIDLASGAAEYEHTRRGAIAWLNDLHKGRNTGPVWQLFIDLIAAACIVFALSGLWILKLHAANRPLTWPLTVLGLVVPALIALLFIH